MGRRVGQPAEPGGGLRGGRGRRARRRACGCPRDGAELVGRRPGRAWAATSRMTHARWPSACRRRGSVSARSAASTAARSTSVQRAVRPRRAPSGHPARRRPSSWREERQRVAGDVGVAAAWPVHERASSRSSSRPGGAPSATGCRRAARARPSGTARRAMPLPYGWARESTVIQSPASRAARRRSCQVRSVSPSSVRSSSPNANQRASSSGSRNRRSATNRSGVGRSRRVALRKPRDTAARSGQRTPWTAPIPGAIRCWPARYSGSARLAEAGRQGGGEGVGVVGQLGEGRRRAPRRAVAVRRHEGDRALGDLAADGRVDHRPGSAGAAGVLVGAGARSVVRRLAARRAEGVPLAQLLLALRIGRDVDAGRGRELGAGRRVDDPPGRVDDAAP